MKPNRPRPGGGKRLLAEAASSKAPSRLRLPRRTIPLAERLTKRSCTCATGRTLACPWHLGRHSNPPATEEGIPRIRGLSTGAWLLFLVIWRGHRWASERTVRDQAKDEAASSTHYAPGRLRLARAVGGRNAATRDRNEDGTLSTGLSYEKGACDLGTITDYLAELLAVRLAHNGLPLVVAVRRCRREQVLVLNPELIEDPRPGGYVVVRPWDFRPPPPSGSSGEAGSDVDPLLSEIPHRLRSRIAEWHHDVGTQARTKPASEILIATAMGSSWWQLFVSSVGNEREARKSLRFLLRRLAQEGVGIDRLFAVFDLLEHYREKGNQLPDSWIGWMFSAARGGWHIPRRAEDIRRDLEEQAEGIRRQALLLEQAARDEISRGRDEVAREMTDDERAEWHASFLAKLTGSPPSAVVDAIS
jgi:hypothetical protein